MDALTNKFSRDFPILKRKVNNHRLIYLDSASTCFKPLSVLNLERKYATKFCANVNRGIHTLSEEASNYLNQSRLSVQNFINAKSEDEIVFTSGTTASINLIARSYAAKYLKAGDEIWISTFEHHSNILPWLALCQEKGFSLKVIPLDNVDTLPFSEK